MMLSSKITSRSAENLYKKPVLALECSISRRPFDPVLPPLESDLLVNVVVLKNRNFVLINSYKAQPIIVNRKCIGGR